MRILVDENIPRRTVVDLRQAGHEVKDLRGTLQEGTADDALWAMAQEAGAVLVTTDKGFVQHRHERHHGVVVVCLRQPNRERIHERVTAALSQFPPDDWQGLTVVMRDRSQTVYRA